MLVLLNSALSATLPAGTTVWIYGSAAKPGRFHEDSDLDLAVDDPEGTLDLWRVMSSVSEKTGRETDVSRLQDLHFADSIRREGFAWTIYHSKSWMRNCVPSPPFARKRRGARRSTFTIRVEATSRPVDSNSTASTTSSRNA